MRRAAGRVPRHACGRLIALLSAVCLVSIPATAQVAEPSLADVARSTRKTKPANPSRNVYDNDSLPKSSTLSGPGGTPSSDSVADAKKNSQADGKMKGKFPVEEYRKWMAEQKQKIADLEYELSRLENDNRLLKTDYEDATTHKEKPRPAICSAQNICYPVSRDPDDERKYNKYKDYVKQRDGKKEELDTARRKLDQLTEEFTKWSGGASR